jgi:hypothetical protein
LAAILRAATAAPPLPLRERLRTVANYCKLSAEGCIVAACRDRPFSPALVRVLGRLVDFINIPAGLLLRHLDLGSSPEAASLLLQQPWVPSAGLDSGILAQVCRMPCADATLIEDLASRTAPDDHGLRALHRLSGEPGPRGDAARAAAALWAFMLPRDDVTAVALDTALEVKELPADALSGPGAELLDLEAMSKALKAPWLQGLRLQGDTARRVYARRPLTADSVRVVRLATQGLEPQEAEALLADVEPCMARHDSRGVVALLDWFGSGEPRPIFARLLHSLLQTASSCPSSPRASPSPDIANGRATASPTSSSRNTRSATPGLFAGFAHNKFLPRRHSRASVEAVEFLLSACPRLARTTIPLDQLGLSAFANGTAATENGIGNGTTGAAESSSSGASGHGRLLPLQTLCLRCETPDPHTALIARALLRRSPEARDHPLPRALRRSARGSKYSVFVCNATTCLQQRRLAAEEAGEDIELLKEMQEIFMAASASIVASPSPPPGAISPPDYPSSPRGGRDGVPLGATPPPRPPPNPPPPRKSPRHPNCAGHLRLTTQPQSGAYTARGEREVGRNDMMPTPRTLCQALAARAARGLPPLGGSPRWGGGGELLLQGCGAARFGAVVASALPAIRAQ